MKLVVDANPFISALVKSGISRKIIFDPEMRLFSPHFLLDEVMEHYSELLTKHRGSTGEFNRLIHLLTKHIAFVSDIELKPFLPAASSLSSDVDDWLYLACALYADAILWSNDAGLMRQRRVRVVGTTELAKELGLI